MLSCFCERTVLPPLCSAWHSNPIALTLSTLCRDSHAIPSLSRHSSRGLKGVFDPAEAPFEEEDRLYTVPASPGSHEDSSASMDVYTLGSDVVSDGECRPALSSGSSEENIKLDTSIFINRVQRRIEELDQLLLAVNLEKAAPGGFVEDQVLLIMEVSGYGCKQATYLATYPAYACKHAWK